MKFLIIWETAIKAVKKNSRRSFLTMLGLIIGVASVITIVSVGRGYEQAQMEKLLNTSDNETTSAAFKFVPTDQEFEQTNFDYFSETDFELIGDIEGVKKVAYTTEPKEDTRRKKKYSIKGEDSSGQIQLIYSTNDAKSVVSNMGRSLEEQDLINQNKVALVSSSILTELDADELLNQVITIDNEDFLIVGVFDAPSYSTLKVQVPATTYHHYWPANQNIGITVSFSSQYKTMDMFEKVVNQLTTHGSVRQLGKYQPSGDGEMADTMGELFSSMTTIFNFVGAISLFISGVGVMNMIYTSVSERTKEIGIRRAMGATEITIQVQFLLEGLTLTLLGGLIGYLCGLLIAKYISLLMQFNFTPDLFTAAFAVIISVVIGIGFSYFPAKSATEKDIVQLVK